MNRVEFMESLSRLLQDIPEEDRIDALNIIMITSMMQGLRMSRM